MNFTINSRVLFLIVCMGLVTYLPRLLPLLFLSRKRLPVWLEEWLDFIPAAILSAIIVPALVIHGSTGQPGHLNFLSRELVTAIPTFIFGLKTRSMGGTVLFGMGLYWLAGRFFH